MGIAEKKQALIHIVEDADEKLTALLFAIADEYNTPDYEYSEEEIQSFYEIRDNLLKDPESGYTPEQAHDLIRNKK